MRNLFLGQVKFRQSKDGIFARPMCPVVFTVDYGTVDHPYFYHVLAAVLISLCFVITLLWIYSVYWRAPKTSEGHVVERDWLTLFLVGFLLYQNPFYCFSQWSGGTVREGLTTTVLMTKLSTCCC